MTPCQHARSTSASKISLPAVTSNIEVPRSSFTSCDNLLRDIEQLHLPIDDTAYRRFSRYVGHHLVGCNDCSN